MGETQWVGSEGTTILLMVSPFGYVYVKCDGVRPVIRERETGVSGIPSSQYVGTSTLRVNL